MRWKKVDIYFFGNYSAQRVTKNTIYSWLKQQDFDKALSNARKKLLDKALEKLTGISMKAVNTLEQLLSAESEAVRRAAAKRIGSRSQIQGALRDRSPVGECRKNNFGKEDLQMTNLEKRLAQIEKAVQPDQ